MLFKDRNIENKFKLLNKDNSEYNINDKINEREMNVNTKKFCNKKVIPTYLLFIYILYPLILLIFLFLKPYPYSKDYTVNNFLFMHLIREDNNSSMILVLYHGYNYAKKYTKKSEFSKNFKLKKYIDIYWNR